MAQIIKQVKAHEVLDSRGRPTLEAEVFVGNTGGKFAVPAGSSKGVHEAHELRDGDPEHFSGLGVKRAIEGVESEIAPALIGLDALDQHLVDQTLIELDGTADKSRLGGNALIGASVACAKAVAEARGVEVYEHLRTLADIKPTREVPLLFMNLVNGGEHAKSKLAFQEYHVVPEVESVGESLEIASEVQSKLGEKLVEKFGSTSANLGDEDGFVPDTDKVAEPLSILAEVLSELGLTDKVRLSLDVAASSFYKDGLYAVNGCQVPKQELMQFYIELIERFNLFSIEDPFEEEDFIGFKELRDVSGIHIVGDDLTVTNRERIKLAVEAGSINAVIIKPNQVGTLTETLEAMQYAREHDIDCIVSHRSGETEDDFVADLAWAFGTLGLKAGAPRGERMAKYNRLWQIQEQTQERK